jgi:hypothetical protein
MIKIGLLLASLSLVTACGVTSEDDTTDSAEQALLGPRCTIVRPYAWHANSSGVGANCFESAARSFIALNPGESVTFFSTMKFSHGSVTVTCHANGDGLWDESFRSCFTGDGGGGGGGEP